LDRERPRTHVRVSPLEICDVPSDFWFISRQPKRKIESSHLDEE
jgi:hypothetical protein